MATQLKRLEEDPAPPSNLDEACFTGTLKVPASGFEGFIRQLAQKLDLELDLSCRHQNGPLVCEYEVAGPRARVQKFRQALQKKVASYRERLSASRKRGARESITPSSQ